MALYPRIGADDAPDKSGEFETVANVDYLYVVSSNVDLSYNNGAVQVVDLKRLDALIADDLSRGELAIGARKLPPEVRGIFDEAIVPEAGVRIGTFGGDFAFRRNVGGKTVGIVSTRQANRLTPIEISADGSTLRCLWTGETTCGEDESVFTGADDPYGVEILDVSTPDAPAGEPYVFAVHLRRGEVQSYSLNAIAANDKVRISESLRTVDTEAFGANDVAFSPVTGLGYVPTRVGISGILVNALALFDPVLMVTGPAESAPSAFLDVQDVAGGTSLRGIVMSPDGSRVYVTSRGPNSVVAIDVSLRPDGEGPRNQIVATQVVGTSPARITYLDLPGDNDLVYVPCIDDDSVYVLRASDLSVVQVLDQIGDGPYDVEAYKRERYDGTGGADGRSLWVAISMFEESTVVAVEIDPVTLLHVPRARIGTIRTTQEDFK